MPKSTPHFMELGVDTCRLIDFPEVASGQLPQPFREWLGEANNQMLFWISIKNFKNNFRRLRDVFELGPPLSQDGTSSWESRRPPDVTCGAAILDPRWRRRHWRQPRSGAAFSTPIVEVEENGGPSASGRHLGWPHSRNPEMRTSKMAAGSGRAAIFLHLHNGVEQAALYYLLAMAFDTVVCIMCKNCPLKYIEI